MNTTRSQQERNSDVRTGVRDRVKEIYEFSCHCCFFNIHHLIKFLRTHYTIDVYSLQSLHSPAMFVTRQGQCCALLWQLTMADGHFSSAVLLSRCWCWDCSPGPGHHLTWQAAVWARTESTPTTLTWLLETNHRHHLPGWGELIFNLNSVSFCHIKQDTEKNAEYL